ncbi:MAG: 4a-hydroxytetrahydrobiopterin dehydratase [Actinobacteria bacterium]|jgi:4a-hydroxytetrahydrobiopterin dehydratase|nr:4a-hydroxytetrahydrobiopterin dehydratase [Actinomycetota bacterium]
MAILPQEQVDAGIRGTAWSHQGDELVLEWQGADFAAALKFVNRVGELAERAQHHPDIDIRWNKVRLTLSTHSEGGVTSKDIELAHQINELDNPPS